MTRIKQNVMASVALIYAARVLFGATALKLYVLLFAVWGIGKLVWVSKIVENLSTVEKSGLASVGNFVLAALEHASTSVQLVLLVALVAAFSLVFDAVRAGATARGGGFAA
jgi:hypothetical protein